MLIFVVDLAVTKINFPTHENYGDMMVLCESMMRGVATNIVTVSDLINNSKQQQPLSGIQLMASSILIFFYLMQVSVGMA